MLDDSWMALGTVLDISGMHYQVVDVIGPDTSTMLTIGGEITIKPFKLFTRIFPMLAAPRHRNDRAYLKRKKGRA